MNDVNAKIILNDMTEITIYSDNAIYNSINYNRLSGIIASVAHGLGILVYALITVIILEYILKKSLFSIICLGTYVL